jgi:signal transduction histidine kinase
MTELDDLYRALTQAAIERTRAEAVARALADVSRALSMSLEPDVVARSAVDHVCRLVDVDMAVLFRLDPESGDFVSVAQSEGAVEFNGKALVMPRGEGAIGLAARERRPVMTADVLTDPRLTAPPDLRHRMELTGYRAVLAVTLEIGQGNVIGALALVDRTGRQFTAEEAAVVQAFAGQAAVAFENARLHAETERRLRDTELLLTVSRAISSTLDLSETMRRIAEAAGRMFGADMVGTYLADPNEDVLMPVAGYHVPKHLLEAFQAFPIPLRGHRLIEESWRTHRPVWSDDLEADARVDRDAWRRFPHRSGLFVPMVVADRPIGGLCMVWWEERRAFLPSEIDLAEGVARQAAIAVANSRLYRDEQEARAALRRLSQRLMEVQEAERRRLAFELHDEIGQSLTALKLNVEMAETAVSGSPAAKLRDGIQLADRVLKQVRSLSLDLRPALLDDLGLAAALRWYVPQQAERAGLAARVNTEIGDTRLPPAIEIACFRIVQEAVTNVLRHAGAGRLFVDLHAWRDRLELAIEDDGAGFDVTAARRGIHAGRSLGLLSMEERVSLIAGELAIDSAPGRGTRIHVSCPLTSS